MRRGGVLTLLIGLLLLVGAGAAFFFFMPAATPTPGPNDIVPTPTEDPGVDVLFVVADSIPANTLLNNAADFFEARKVPTKEFNPDKDISSLDDVEGKLLIKSLKLDVRLERSMITEPGLSQQIPTAEPNRPRPKAYPLVVTNLTGVADQIKPGDFIDVVVTYKMKRPVAYTTGRTIDPVTGAINDTRVVNTEELFYVTKAIVQQAQVLRILRPAVPSVSTTPEPAAAAAPSSGAPGTAQAPPAASPTQEPGSAVPEGFWTLIIAVDAQEAELLEFAQTTESKVTLMLRGAGDSTFEPTIGASYDLLVSEFGVSAPRWLDPQSLAPEDTLKPDPSPTPAPTRIP